MDGETVERHPSFGQISVSRVSGTTHLYGSDFTHHHFVSLRVHRSEVRRHLSTDWPMADSRPLIEVDMSESQWASLLSSLNVGSGVQCTLRYVNGEKVPDPPPPPARGDQFAGEVVDHLDGARAALRELRERVAAGKAGKESLRLIDQAEAQINANKGYVERQFRRHMEGLLLRAKTEINAYAGSVMARVGLGRDAEPPMSLPAPAKLEEES